jgi:hypothetical protein
MVLAKWLIEYGNIAASISKAGMVVMSSILDTISLFITDACDVVDDVSMACMIILRFVSNDVSIVVTDTLIDIEDVSPVGTSNTCFASYDLCFNDLERARVSCCITVAATDFGRCISGGIRIHYTEMLSISQRRQDSPQDLRTIVSAYISMRCPETSHVSLCKSCWSYCLYTTVSAHVYL